VDIVATATADLRGVARMLKGFAAQTIPVAAIAAELSYPGPNPTQLSPRRQAVRFGAVGFASTIAYLVLFVLLRGSLGAQGANLAALLATAVANTAANRRFTFGVRGRAGAARHQLLGLAVFAIALGITSGSLDAVHSLVADPSRSVELAMLLLANLSATLIRFVLLRAWVFHSRGSRWTGAAGTLSGSRRRTDG
jgi:putative flippase GtrA